MGNNLNTLDDFTDDVEKMVDYLNLSKDEFLKSYSYLTEQEYDNTDELFHDDIVGNLLWLWRKAENLAIDEQIELAETIKTSVDNYAQSNLDGCVYEEYLELIPTV